MIFSTLTIKLERKTICQASVIVPPTLDTDMSSLTNEIKQIFHISYFLGGNGFTSWLLNNKHFWWGFRGLVTGDHMTWQSYVITILAIGAHKITWK